ncbi:SusC/RagA family TonB-linked outer membrane protein [Chitinophaga sp. NPDC101104]|uniref:SusC/RagA family TonB-linked outer membrane protein n=1 Tax=Chitinophaga sp. NPDC101104 TaxID=3390561 RepID=UPI003CFBDC3E
MKKFQLAAIPRLLVLLCSLLLCLDSFAQSLKISGTVTGADGQKIPGASVSLASARGTGTVTDANGHYSLSVPASNTPVTLVVSFIGYDPVTLTLQPGQTSANITLAESTRALNEVVVTALGIKKARKAVTYSVSEVKGADLTQAREINVVEGLTGKVAGVSVSGLAAGPGSSSRVIIRGNGSFGNNQPLYVINGMPMDNSTSNVPSSDNASIGLNADRGDGIGGINPDDIETISILKGATASALYGSRAANGVVIITTKRGVKQKGIGLEYNSTLTLEAPAIVPDWQYEYGQGIRTAKPTTKNEAINSGRLSWGPKLDGSDVMQFDGVARPYVAQKDNIKNFYRTGSTFTNTVAVNGGSELGTYRLSMSDMNNKGLLPNAELNKKIFSLAVVANLHKRLTVEGYAQYNKEKAKGRSNVADATGNPNWGVYMLANSVDVRSLAPGYDLTTGNETQWNPSGFATNPYFAINKFINNDDRDRFLGNLNVKFNILDNLFVRGRVTHDFTNINWLGVVPSGTAYEPRGYYQEQTNGITETNAELTLNYQGRFGRDFTVDVLAGGNRQRYRSQNKVLLGNYFAEPGFYDPSNVKSLTTTNVLSRSAVNSLFASADFGYRDMLFLTVTGRNDWFSTLDPANNHIFYPSIGGSFILSEAANLPKSITFAKLRASWAQVGGGAPQPYALNQTYHVVPGGGHFEQPLQTPSQVNGAGGGTLTAPNKSLRPYTNTTLEAGFEARFLNNRLSADFAVYDRRTKDDIVNITISQSSGYNFTNINIGEMSNKGVELLLSGVPVQKQHFSWEVSLNAAYNKNEVVRLADGINSIEIGRAVNGYATISAVVGKPFSMINATKVLRNAQGQAKYTANGWEMATVAPEQIGTGVAPWNGGINNNFKYKNWNLGFLVDGRFGGYVYSGTNLYSTRFGLNKITLPGRDGGLTVTGVNDKGEPFSKTLQPSELQGYYDNWKAQSERFVYKSDFIKLRQVILGYKLPVDRIGAVKFQSASLSFVARNLLILHKKTPNVDPESTFNNSNAQGFEMFGVPRTRSFGLNLMVKL